MKPKEIALEMLQTLIKENKLTFEDYPEAKNYLDLVIFAYNKILNGILGDH